MPSIVFLCSPNLGIADSWMSVLSMLRKQVPDGEFIFLLPLPREVLKIEEESVLFQVANEIFDSVVFRGSDGEWHESKTFAEAKVTAQSFNNKYFQRLKTTLRKLGLGNFLGKLRQSSSGGSRQIPSSSGLPRTRLSRFIGDVGVLLFDITEVDKSYLGDVMESFRNVPKFSLSHGLTVNLSKWDGVQVSLNDYLPSTTKVFAGSHLEEQFFREKYQLPARSVEVIGVPRHESHWLSYIQDLHKNRFPVFGQDFIFLASKPSNGSYLPRSRKIQNLRQVREIAEKYRLHVVVKRHPKEVEDGTFEKVFGERNLGKTWSLSSAHPFFLGEKAVFSITFGGSVPVDMIAIGTPVIGLLNLTNLNGFDDGSALRNEVGEPVRAPEFLGLLLPGKDEKALKAAVEEVMSNRAGVVKQLRSSYQAVYPDPSGANKKIVLEVVKSLADPPRIS